MSGLMDRLIGWATPVASRTNYAVLAQQLGHKVARHDCLPRRQGLCPGLDQCHDCPWTEGISRQDPR
ncbi:MAG: hypothetical protein AABZ67_01245 [Pseudomonadota bacterium]